MLLYIFAIFTTKLAIRMLLHIFVLLWAVASGGSEIGLRNCPEKCGNVTIPYPFGIGDGCFYNNENSRIADSDTSIYSVKCSRNGTDPPRTHIGNDIEVVKITVDGELWVPYPVAYNCSAYNSSGQINHINEYARTSGNWKMNGRSIKFTISLTKNSLLGYGCAASVWFVLENYSMKNRNLNIPAPSSRCQTASCITFYIPRGVNNTNNYDSYKTDLCPTGFACCQASITDGKAIDYIQATRTEIRGSNLYDITCRVGFAVANDAIPNITMQYLPHLVFLP